MVLDDDLHVARWMGKNADGIERQHYSREDDGLFDRCQEGSGVSPGRLMMTSTGMASTD